MRFVLKSLFTLAALSASPVLAQQAPSSPQPASGQYEYVLLVATKGGNAVLDFGQSREMEKELEKRAPVTEQEIEAFNVRKLERAVPALNYLSSRGWECLGLSGRQQSTGNTGSGSFSISSATEYLLRRRRP
jgi:hypothetical protein